jgi:nucleoside 2-deoxyribosyltransferase
MAKIYLSGKMSGLPDFNRPKFDKFEALLIAQGHTVVVPHKCSPFHPNKAWEDYMKEDIKYMLECDMVAVLDDYIDSAGAMIEVLLARNLKMKVVDADTFKSII